MSELNPYPSTATDESVRPAGEECKCTNPVHGGKIYKCNTPECEYYVAP